MSFGWGSAPLTLGQTKLGETYTVTYGSCSIRVLIMAPTRSRLKGTMETETGGQCDEGVTSASRHMA